MIWFHNIQALMQDIQEHRRVVVNTCDLSRQKDEERGHDHDQQEDKDMKDKDKDMKDEDKNMKEKDKEKDMKDKDIGSDLVF